MKKTILEIYALAICFVAIIFLIINISDGVYNIIGMVNPDLTMSSFTYDPLQSNERYREKCCEDDKSKKTNEEIARLREEAYKIELRSEARDSLQKAIKNLIYVLLSGIVLFGHWKLSRSARESNT